MPATFIGGVDTNIWLQGNTSLVLLPLKFDLCSTKIYYFVDNQLHKFIKLIKKRCFYG